VGQLDRAAIFHGGKLQIEWPIRLFRVQLPGSSHFRVRLRYRGKTRLRMSLDQTDIDEASKGKSARFDVTAIAASFPPTASTLLIDRYLTNRQVASARVFRVYKPTPPHYHATCDEYLFVLSGRGTFWMEDASTQAEFVPGNLLFFERGTVHALPDILEEPLVFLSVDTPRREPTDIIFVNPEDGTPATFMARNASP
jgi:mannose-6-phosphate isomerase-like protein (cupin superfamily)